MARGQTEHCERGLVVKAQEGKASPRSDDGGVTTVKSSWDQSRDKVVTVTEL